MQTDTFNIIGIAVRTTNENGQSSKDIPALWNTFMAEGILAKIPNRISDDIYCMYTEYEKDHTKPYTTIIGCKVADLTNVPTGMVGKTIETAQYAVHTVQGNIMEGIVYNEWLKIWDADLPRTFIADFEIYGEKAQDPANATIDIFVGIQ
ncbi:MAG: effector binding domain-containing protein [Bacteroidota bacterium]